MDGEGERKTENNLLCRPILRGQLQNISRKIEFYWTRKKGKTLSFQSFQTDYEVCAQTAQGQRLKRLVKWPVLNILLLKTFQLLVYRSFY